jgi:hypothetical protein
MALHRSSLPDLIVGARKVLASGTRYAKVIYIFQYDGDKLVMVTNKAQGVGELVATVVAEPSPAEIEKEAFDKRSRSEPADYNVQYEGTSKP